MLHLLITDVSKIVGGMTNNTNLDQAPPYSLIYEQTDLCIQCLLDFLSENLESLGYLQIR